MVKHILSTLCLLGCCFAASAQQTLNLHTTTSGIVSFTFAQEPKVTFPSPEVIKVTTETVTVEFPFSEVEKVTFDDETVSVQTITVREKDSQTVSVYDLSGKLVRQYAARQGATTVDISALPRGTYIVKDGKRAYKVMKR